MTDAKLISVVMPVLNGARYLAEAIDSVFAQTYPEVELVVVDDGSTDDSARIAQSYGDTIRYAYQAQAGIGAARNHAMALARGDCLAFLDCDDIYPRERLEIMHNALSSSPAPDAVAGHIKQFLSPELADELAGRIRCPEHAMPGQISTCMLIPRDVFRRVGEFAVQWNVGVDMEWYLRATDAGLKIRMLPDTILLRRLHDRNNGIVHRDSFLERTHILKAAIDRRRAARSSQTISD